MSFVHGSRARVYVNGFDLSAMFNTIESQGSVQEHETTGLGLTSSTYMPGLRQASITADGLFSNAVGASHPVLSQAISNEAPIVWEFLPLGDVDGEVGVGMLALSSTYNITSPVDGLVDVSADATANTRRDFVRILAPLTARTATANGVSRDNAALTSAGGAAYLQVTGMAGTSPSLAVRIQHSVDNSVWADLVTFTTVIAANTAQRIEVAGTVNRWLRAIWTITGTGGPSFTFHAAFARN